MYLGSEMVKVFTSNILWIIEAVAANGVAVGCVGCNVPPNNLHLEVAIFQVSDNLFRRTWIVGVAKDP